MSKSKDKVKAIWDVNATKVFIDLCVEQVKLGTRKSSSFTKNGWGEIVRRFHEHTGRLYERQQFKNKYDSMRKEWQLWERLMGETGIGWDTERNTVSASDDWWEKKIMEVKEYEKFRSKGLQFHSELSELFSKVAATGTNQWTPSATTKASGAGEGSGDSDEVRRAQTGVSAEFNTVNFNDTSGGSASQMQKGTGSSSGARTSTSLGVRRTGERKGKKKGPAAAKIADALTMIANEAREDREEARADREEARAIREQERAQAYAISIAGVLAHLRHIPEVVARNDFYRRCRTLLVKDPSAREAYAALKDTPEELIQFLHHSCYGT